MKHVLHFERIVVCKQAASLQSPLTMIQRPFFNSKIKLFVGHKIYKVLCPFETVPGLQYCGIFGVSACSLPTSPQDSERYFFCRCSALLGSKSKQQSEAFDGEWQNGMKGSIFDQAEL